MLGWVDSAERAFSLPGRIQHDHRRRAPGAEIVAYVLGERAWFGSSMEGAERHEERTNPAASPAPESRKDASVDFPSVPASAASTSAMSVSVLTFSVRGISIFRTPGATLPARDEAGNRRER